MLVWIVNPFDTLPAEGSRPLRFWLMAEAFVRAGHDVVYWTADFNHVTKKARTIGGPPRPESGIKVEMVHEPPYSRNVGLARLWAHWRWAKNWRRAAELAPRPGLIVVSSPPLAIGSEVRRFAAKRGAKVVVDVMDAWPETFERVAPRWALWPLRRLARANYIGADAVTTVADNYASLLPRDRHVRLRIRAGRRSRRFPDANSLRRQPRQDLRPCDGDGGGASSGRRHA